MAFFSRLILTIGWAIYPMGYFIEHLEVALTKNVNIVIILQTFKQNCFWTNYLQAATQDTRSNV